jgi:catechol 2,3-dioxygenase-like lactoylglutathione lyase family enzyme
VKQRKRNRSEAIGSATIFRPCSQKRLTRGVLYFAFACLKENLSVLAFAAGNNMQWILRTLLIGALFAARLPESSPALSGIAHVAFRVSDVAKSREFYRALGFEQSFEVADPGKPQVSYIKISDHQFVELYGRADNAQPIGLMHVCYEAADIESLWSEYTKRGLNPPPARKARAGNLLFLFHDPENQILEYTQYLPGSLHFEDRGKHLSQRRIAQHLKRAAMVVQDLPAEFAFFTSKLAFEEIVGATPRRLHIPGGSGDEVELELATATAKPRIVFSVMNLASTAAELRKRSFTVMESADSVSISDPDGTEIIFELEYAAPKTPSGSKD